jgi:RHS repeat-associated protein
MRNVLAAIGCVLGSVGASFAQITMNEGDGVLNAPYRGTITSLRECSADVGYGEVRSHVEPFIFCTTQNPDPCKITSSTIDIWVEGAWDRSVLRMYQGLDASGSEVNLTGTSEFSPETIFTDGTVKRFSFKAIGTKTLAPQTFTVRMSYILNGFQVTPTRIVTVAPITGSFCALPGESEAFLLGTPILDISVGNAKLTVPVGRTAEMIGAAFIDKKESIALTGISTNDVLFPGAAETLHIQNNDQFRLGSSAAAKTDWGTPWPGHLIGYQINTDPFGPDGTHYDSLTAPSAAGFVFRRIDFIRPMMQSEVLPASVRYVYDNGSDNHVTEIRDQATPPNVITLTRAAGIVSQISTSDGRSWQIEHDPTEGWITAVRPSGGLGTRLFEFNAAGRVTRVRNGNNDLLYEFAYTNDPAGMPTILTEERRFVDNALQTVVQHEVVSESLKRRKEYTGTGEFRQFDFNYDTANGLKHRLASITSYENVNAGGTPRTTTLTHDVNNAAGSMVITQVALPDGSTIAHDYDKHIGAQSVHFGFRTKSTRTGPDDGSLVTFDATYEFFYCSAGQPTCVDSARRLFHRPRIVKQRDGRGAISEVTFDYDNGGVCIDDEGFCNVNGEHLNRLLSMTGPTISLGTSGVRTPRTRFTYDDAGLFPTFVLQKRETEYASGMFRAIEYAYDPLFRLITQTVDPSGANMVTRYLYCDTAPTQDRITVDPEGYWTRTRFDNNGHLTTTERFLNANAGNVDTPCVDPAGPVYKTTSSYNTNGYLQQQVVENKDQDGVPLTPATITTTFSPDRLGRLELRTVDPEGIGQASHFDYNWLGGIERQFDASGRGTKRTYDGRGLVKSETPLALAEAPDNNLTTTFTYDAMGNLRFTNRPTGAVEERVYDDFGRVKQTKRIPGPDGGNTITTTFEYDLANHVTRTAVDEAATVLSDSTAKFDEGGFNYESRQRTVAAADNATDPLTQRKFDWAGNIIEEKSLGDATVADRVITTEYDGANRVRRVTDSLGGETIFARDDRGNVLDQTVKIDATNSAVTTTVYDALSRAIQVTSPEDGSGGRPDRVRRYDSRNNLLRETIRDASDVPKLTTAFGYDNAGRQTRQAALANAASTILASAASLTTDRVADSVFDADGRLGIRRTYNNNSATPLNTTTTYDDLGRVDRVTDPSPSNSYTDEDYADNGRLSMRSAIDGVGTQTFTFGYDGHDRVKQQTAVGTPNLITAFTLDGHDRQTRITDPKGIATRTDFDLVGRRKTLVEDDTGALQRQTDFTYNRLSQLITQTAKNKTSTGSPLPDQLTTYRYHSLGRQTRSVYPDSTQHADPPNCTDCVRQTFDLAGRLTQRIDQRLLTTVFSYEDRGPLLTRTTGTDRDTFGYDAVGRITLADRGTIGSQAAVSHSVMAYTELGDLDFETQSIAGGTARMVDYGYDQAGNRKQLTYPGTEVLTYTPTVLNQVDAVNLNASPLLDYVYQGRLLDKRRTTTTAPGGNTVYEYDVGYDSHRRVNAITNRFQPGGGNPQTVAAYGFTHDNNGNPLAQTATEGMPDFVADDRAFTVDRLNRLKGTEYFENGQVESTTLDLVGNRESHTDRAGAVTGYGPVNAANEYPTIGGSPITYDAAGNLAIDQAGRQYSYDEHNRLKQIKNAANVVLANYTYDALGRRITFNDPVAAVTTRYYYDGQSVIEERNAADARIRYHVNGSQFIDEHVATFTQAPGQFTYYLANNNFSVAGTGNADGSLIERLDFSSTGDFAGGGPGASSFHHDADHDLDLDLRDFANFQNCFGQTNGPCLPVHDFDTADASDGDIDLDDYARFSDCSRGPFVTPDQACGITQVAGTPSGSGVFTLHGRPVDFLSDGSTLMDFRARNYSPALGRWLQRDSIPYNDGFNLYESFGNNALANLDPTGEGILTWLLVGDYSLSDAKFLRDNGIRAVTTPIYGCFEGGAQTVAGGAKEFGLIFVGESAAQQRLVNFVEAEFEVGGATADETSIVVLRATGQGIVDFFGASNVATAVTGEQIVFVQEGRVFIVEASAFERLQAGVGGVGQFAGTVAGLGGGGLGRLGRPATPGVTTAARRAVRVRVLSNIAESQAARAASRFEVFAAHEAALPALTARGGALPIRVGQAGLAETTLAFERGNFAVVGREITMQTSVARTRLDLLVEAPQAGGVVPGTTAQVGPLQQFFVEVKTGTGRLSPNQRMAFPEIEKVGGIPRGLRAEQAGLTVGKQSRAFEVIIIRR